MIMISEAELRRVILVVGGMQRNPGSSCVACAPSLLFTDQR